MLLSNGWHIKIAKFYEISSFSGILNLSSSSKTTFS